MNRIDIFGTEIMKVFFKESFIYFAWIILFASFLFTYYIIPKITKVVREKGLLKVPNERDAHTKATPTFGGVAFFMTLMLSIACILIASDNIVLANLSASITIIFMVGVKDDLIVSSARVKFIGQLVAAMVLLSNTSLQITSLSGFMGIYTIPRIAGLFLGLFITTAIINAYNLIDGINGLAGIVGAVIFTAYFFLFLYSGQHIYALISLIAIGMLLAFLRYNCAGFEKRIFMGDSGSLIVGLLTSFLTLRFLSMGADSEWLTRENLFFANRIPVVAVILFIPAFDMVRVSVCRLLKGNSIFKADRNHTHHVLLNAGLTHIKASLVLGGVHVSAILILSLSIVFLGEYPLAIFMIMAGLFFLFALAVNFIHKKNIAREYTPSPAALDPKYATVSSSAKEAPARPQKVVDELVYHQTS